MINNNGSINDRKMLDPVTSVLYEPSLSMNDWSYSHHPSVCRFGGRFWAAWSNGETNEDDIGQRVLCAVSRDGVKWEKPWILFDSVPGNHVLTAAGFHTGDNRLIAYAGIYGYTDDNIENYRCVSIGVKHTGTTLLCRSTGDGEIWSDTSDTGIAVVPNQGPQVLNSGRLIICGNIAFPYSDCPDGLQGWTMSGLEPRLQPGMYDDSEGFLIHMKSRRDNRFLCEGSYFQTEDDVIHMLLRSDEGVMYCSESRDDGESWSAPRATAFSDCGAKFHCGRLPDGRFYIVSNPDPGPRCPLVISVAEDGKNFNRSFVISDIFRPLRIPGRYKGGIYGYPHSLIDCENIHVICSVNKEDVYVFTVPLSQLA